MYTPNFKLFTCIIIYLVTMTKVNTIKIHRTMDIYQNRSKTYIIHGFTFIRSSSVPNFKAVK